MASFINNWAKKTLEVKNLHQKFTAVAQAITHQPGRRVVPTNTPTKNEEFGCRIDTGPYNAEAKELTIFLQVNREAEKKAGDAVKDWVKKNTTHGILATEKFNVAAEDPVAETERCVLSMADQAKEKLG